MSEAGPSPSKDPQESTSAENEMEEETITLDEFIEEETRLETDANAVLGPSDDKNCTYIQGYSRQALYACKTCIPLESESWKPAGVCLACSYHCHEGHDLVELYTKRNFRCDCGNSLFNGKHCNLDAKKVPLNEDNKYNQNFKGVYCTCSRPYPDPDDENPDDMFQCAICEDWFHKKHLDCDVPSEESFAEMICGPCTNRLTFLPFYLGLAIEKKTPTTEGSEKLVDVCKTGEAPKENEASNENQNQTVPEPQKESGDGERKESNECIRTYTEPLKRNSNGATFWPENFRNLLCKCSSCQVLYESLGVPWITDPGDTVSAYESKGKAEGDAASKARSGDVLQALSGMNRYQQIEAIQSYNDLKSSLFEYLAKFAENKKVVREEDIREFFSQLEARKRQKLSAPPPYMCR